MLNQIIESCKYVTSNPKHVTINYDKLVSFAHQIENIEMKHWLSDSPFGFPSSQRLFGGGKNSVAFHRRRVDLQRGVCRSPKPACSL